MRTLLRNSRKTGRAAPLALLWIWVWIAAIGLALSLWVHVGAVMGFTVAPFPLFVMLHVGIFVVWIPAVRIMRKVRPPRQVDFWKVALKGVPTWARYAMYGFFGYAFINFFIFISQPGPRGAGNNPSAPAWRGFSGHWMAFYSAALLILYSETLKKRE